jgi:Dna[CI] antecedent, DciA
MHRTRSLSDILCELIVVRGYGRLFAREILENAWNTAIGEPYCRQTQVGEICRGVLSVTVAHSSLLEELVAFRKAALLAVLQSSDLGTAVHDIQFQVGSVVFDIKNEP